MKRLNINRLKYNEVINLELNDNNYIYLKKNIAYLEKKYSNELEYLYDSQKEIFEKYSFFEMTKYILTCQEIVLNIITDVITLYKNHMKYLECVFICGSFARGTNKKTSDLDLHFFYSKDINDYLYEEIVCYIITTILKKRRDCIDPEFILNFHNNKEIISKMMNSQELDIKLISNYETINYAYQSGKKRRFYLQYCNSRKLYDLQKELLAELMNENPEYLHCFKIILGDKVFSSMYEKIFDEELKIINSNYILKKIDELNGKLLKKHKLKDNKICYIKELYQSYYFKIIFEYFSILRFILLLNGYKINYFNLLEIMRFFKERYVFNEIYKYFWLVEKMANYSAFNHVPYSLHSEKKLNYDFEKLNLQWEIVVYEVQKDLERRKKYEKNNFVVTNDAC